MTKRRLLRCSLLVVALAAFAVWLEPTRVVWGWLRGEAFYQGRPSCWWAAELGHWDVVFLDPTGRPRAVQSALEDLVTGKEFIFLRKKQLAWLGCWLIRQEPNERPSLEEMAMGSTLLHGEVEAEEVLRELAEHPHSNIRRQAKHGIHMIELQRRAKESKYRWYTR
jgi:hypothetical protein